MLITSEAVGPCLDFFTVCGDQIVNTFSKCNNPFFMLYHYFEEKLLMLSKFSNSKKMGFQSLILNNTKSQYQGTLMIVYYLHSDKPSCCHISSTPLVQLQHIMLNFQTLIAGFKITQHCYVP
jgi:hypothetical protein